MTGRWLRRMAGSQGHLLLLLLGKMTRIELTGDPVGIRMLQEGESCLISCWHGKMLLPFYYLRRRQIQVLVSLHRDGDIIAGVLGKLGYGCVRGSSTRRGTAAREELEQLLRQGATGFITPDGPTGPREQLKTGVVILAQNSGVPVLPVTFDSNRMRRFNSWDRFAIWLPFSRSRVLVGKPLPIPPEQAVEQVRKSVEIHMQQLEEECTRMNS